MITEICTLIAVTTATKTPRIIENQGVRLIVTGDAVKVSRCVKKEAIVITDKRGNREFYVKEETKD